MTIEEEQARAIREATARMDRSDSETLVHIARVTEHSHCAVCRAVHGLATEERGRVSKPKQARG